MGSFAGCYLSGISCSCGRARLCCQPCQVYKALELGLESELVFFMQSFRARHLLYAANGARLETLPKVRVVA